MWGQCRVRSSESPQASSGPEPRRNHGHEQEGALPATPATAARLGGVDSRGSPSRRSATLPTGGADAGAVGRTERCPGPEGGLGRGGGGGRCGLGRGGAGLGCGLGSGAETGSRVRALGRARVVRRGPGGGTASSDPGPPDPEPDVPDPTPAPTRRSPDPDPSDPDPGAAERRELARPGARGGRALVGEGGDGPGGEGEEGGEGEGGEAGPHLGLVLSGWCRVRPCHRGVGGFVTVTRWTSPSS